MQRTLPPLGPLSEKLKDSGLTWLDFTKAVKFEYTKINEPLSWFYFFRVMIIWIVLLTSGWMLYQTPQWNWYHYFLSFLFGVMIVGCYASLYTIAHDCGHFCFSKYKWANKLVGHFVMSFVHIGFHNWKISHNFHHTFSQCINKDTTWTKDKLTAELYEKSDVKKKKEYYQAYATPIGILFGYFVACFCYLFFSKYHSFISLEKEQRRQLFFSSFLVGVVSLAHFFLFYYLGGWAFYLNYHLLPLTIGGVTAVGIPLLQHAHEEAVYFDQQSWSPLRGQILGTYNFRVWYWLERVYNDINLHIVHHINPKVPWYNIRPAYNDLKEKYPEYILEYDLSWSALKKIYENPVVEWDSRFNLYRAAPFRSDM